MTQNIFTKFDTKTFNDMNFINGGWVERVVEGRVTRNSHVKFSEDTMNGIEVCALHTRIYAYVDYCKPLSRDTVPGQRKILFNQLRVLKMSTNQ